MLIRCVCGHERVVAVHEGSRIDWCPKCGTGATIPPPDRDVHGDGLFDDAAAGYGGDRLGQRDQWFHEARVRLRWMRRHVANDAPVLEIGAATGEFVAVAEQAGHPIVGLESSPWAAAAAQSVTPHVQPVDLQSWHATQPDKTFDAVAMFHVLEHFDEPGSFLRDLHSVTKPGSVLFIEVPNGASSAARNQNGGWWAARLEDHHFHFTPTGITALLSSTGWQVVQLRQLAMDIYARNAPPRFFRAARDFVRPLFGRGRHSRDLLRVAARRA